MYSSFGLWGAFSVVLMLLIKLFFIIFVVGLVVGIFVEIKNLLFTKEDFESIKNTFRNRPDDRL